MSLTYDYLHYLTFNISNIWCKIDSLLTLLQSMLKLYLEYIWTIIGGLIIAKARYRLLTPDYNFFYETKWSRSSAHVNPFFRFILNFTTTLINFHYRDFKTLNIIFVCNRLCISLLGFYQGSVCLIEACSQSEVLELAA